MEHFEQVYSLYFKDVYRYIMSLCHDPAEAEEITQETFFQAMKSMKSFRGDCKMTVWLCQIAKHIYFSRRRKQKRNAALDSYEKSDYDTTSVTSMELILSDEEDALRIHEYLHHLDEPYKEVFMLRIFGELSLKKIAHIFGKTENWARVTYHRAKVKIINEIENDNQKIVGEMIKKEGVNGRDSGKENKRNHSERGKRKWIK